MFLRLSGDIRYQAVFFMGLPAAGKSTFKLRHHLRHAGFVDIDPDQIKKTHPEYDPERPYMVHEWSAGVAESLFQKVLQTGDPFIIDETGSRPDKFRIKMETAKDAGYRIFLIYVVVPPEISLYRNRNRPRFVPEALILIKAKQTDAAFKVLRRIADHVRVVPNYEDRELQEAKRDLAKFPPPQATRPPRPPRQQMRPPSLINPPAEARIARRYMRIVIGSGRRV